MKQTILCLLALLCMGIEAYADTDTRKDPELSFYTASVGVLAGQSIESGLLNPHGLSPITYTTSNETVSMVDANGKIYTALVEQTTVVTITASFAGNDEYRPGTATLEVGIVPRSPLKTPVVTPLGGTFDSSVQVNISTDDPNATEIWYSTAAKTADDFKESDTNISTVVPGQQATITIDRSCTLFVMTRGTGVKSGVVEAQYIINRPLAADFTTDRSVWVDYEQTFDSYDDLTDWSISDGWHLDDLKFGNVRPGDSKSIAITYAAGEGKAPLYSPALDIKEGQRVEFYAYFKTKNLKWAPWTLNAIDLSTGEAVTLFNIYRWTLENHYVSDDVSQWKKFSIDLSAYAGKKIQLLFNYEFDGENLALDGFRLVRDNPEAITSITTAVNAPILFTSLSQGEPDKTEWSFPGAASVKLDGNDAIVTYTTTGTYDVTLKVSRGEETQTLERKAFVHVSGIAPKANIVLPSEAYESPSVGLFVPTGVPISFGDASEGYPTSWSWEFTGAATVTSTAENPSVVFGQAGTYDISLTASNGNGSDTYTLDEYIQAGGKQYVWNISPDEQSLLKAITYDGFGYYAGCNLFGLDRFAEKYKAPLADATVKQVAVLFASVGTATPDAAIPLALYDVAADGAPGKVLAQTSLKASQLRAAGKNMVETMFEFDQPVQLSKGQEFFVAIGPFPYQGVRDETDQIALCCVSRTGSGKYTTWDLAQYSDRWIANKDGHASMAIAPQIDYGSTATAVTPATATADHGEPTAYYNLSGQRVSSPQHGTIYIVRYQDGTSRKVMW